MTIRFGSGEQWIMFGMSIRGDRGREVFGIAVGG